LKQLAKTANLYDPEEVKNDKANAKVKNANKIKIHMQYDAFTKYAKIKWEKPNTQETNYSHFIPTETELDQLIARNRKKTALFLQLLKDTY